jgi:uncharacterized alkaline shock family protein YloU
MDNVIDKGKTTIAPDVLLTTVRLTTLQVDGVSRMGPVPARVNRLFRRGYGEGVRIEIQDNTVYTDIYVILNNDVNIRDVSRTIQSNVGRAISEIIGMEIGRINIHIEDIDYPETSEA